MIKKLTLISMAIAATVSFASADPSNDKCPVSGKAVDKSITSKNVVVLGACCDKCSAKLEKDPDSYKKAIAEATGKAVNSKCPFTGKAIDAEKTVTHEGQTVALCCGKCVKKAEADPAAMIAKVKADAPGNDKCPVSGKALDPDVVVRIEQEIGFCCGKCKTKFDKDPAAVLKKAS